jgi:hypothetical protein
MAALSFPHSLHTDVFHVAAQHSPIVEFRREVLSGDRFCLRNVRQSKRGAGRCTGRYGRTAASTTYDGDLPGSFTTTN